MEDAFGIVLVVVVALAALVAVGTLVTSGKSYDQIGRGGLSLGDGDDPPADRAVGGGATAGAEREAEIRQMLDARNALRRRRGRAPLDVEAELRALTRPAIDAGIEGEIRDLVHARNARRARRGEPQLDVEAEVAREIRALGGDPG
jgi:hypothetical protein